MQNAKCKVQNGADEESVETIEPEGRLVRVNLRPLVGEDAGLKAEDGRTKSGAMAAVLLAEALLESARSVKGSPGLMRRRLGSAVRWCRKNLPRQAAKLERLAAEAAEAGYPALHHSPAYRRAYLPAYRVILRGYIRKWSVVNGEQ
jgi:hypothetical protein